MNNEEEFAIIKYRLDKSYKTFQEAELLASKGFYEAAVNRLYYSAFYSVLALLYKNKFHSKTHKGINILFQKNFIATAKLDKVFGKIYLELLNLRQEADYQDLIEVYESEYITLKNKTDDFLKEIQKLI